MRFWTVQPLSVWTTIQQTGLCNVDIAKMCTPGFAPSQYFWLADQLAQRHGGFSGVALPWWLYCGKPDLRWVRWSRPAGQAEVRLELELPPDRECHFLIEDWDRVYCTSWLFRSPKRPRSMWWDFRERRGWEDLQLEEYPEPYRSLLQRSWDRLFDPSRLIGHSRYRMEGVVETIHLGDVVRADQFIGCSRYR